MHPTLRAALSTAALTCGLNLHCFAEQIVVPVGAQQGALSARADLPGKGLSMGQVMSRYGAPEQKTAPVGHPPISTWEYPTFTVYFEHQHTIHSVIKHVAAPTVAPTPPAIEHEPEPAADDSEE